MIFGRNWYLAAEFAAVFASWNDRPERSALAHNLKFDDRVPLAKEASLLEVLREGRELEASYTLHDAVVDYRKKRVYTSVNPEFLDEVKNEGNLPSKQFGTKWLPPCGVKLVRLLELNGLITLFQKDWLAQSIDSRFEQFKQVPTNHPDRYLVWLNDNIERSGRTFLENILEVLNEDLKRCEKNPGEGILVYPSWVSLLGDVPEGNLARWCQTVGMPISEPTWVCLLKYDADRAGTPVRPTQLEAGANFRHFPTPGDLEWTSGGHPVDFGSGVQMGRLPREYLHYPIRLESTDLRDWELIRPTSYDLVEVRDRHFERLRQEYCLSRDVKTWMSDHISGKFRRA